LRGRQGESSALKKRTPSHKSFAFIAGVKRR
jgi:hypothetical protein